MRRMLAAVACVLLSASSASATIDTIKDRAKNIAEDMQKAFGCDRRACLEKSIQYGGTDETIPQQYRTMLDAQFSALDSDSRSEGHAVAGILAVLVGACTWHPDECSGVVITGAEYKIGATPRHNGPTGTHALTMRGFASVQAEVRLMARMALVAEYMGLKLNTSLGRVGALQIADVDVNGHEIDVKISCHEECECSGHKKKKRCHCHQECDREKGAVAMKLGPLTLLQALFGIALEEGTFPDDFLLRLFGDKQYIFPAVQALTTFYGPGSQSTIEGPWQTSLPNLEAEVNEKNEGIPRTLDDVRLGKFPYVTLASDPVNYGKYFDMGAITYTSPIDKVTYTGDRELADRGFLCVKYKDKDSTECETKIPVVFSERLVNMYGVVHDTGGAFRPETCSHWHTCGLTTYKFDVAVGDFRGWSARDAERFVDDGDKQPYGQNKMHVWQEIGELPFPVHTVGGEGTKMK